jgi:hypothetical protein
MDQSKQPTEDRIDPRALQERITFREVGDNYKKIQYIDLSKSTSSGKKGSAFSRSHEEEEEEPIKWDQLTAEQSTAFEKACVSMIIKPENSWLKDFLEALTGNLSKIKRSEEDEKLLTQETNLTEAQKERINAMQDGFVDANQYIPKKVQWTSAKRILQSWNLAEMRCAWGKMVKLTDKGKTIVRKAIELMNRRTQKEIEEEKRSELIALARKAVRKVFKRLGETNQEIVKSVAETLVSRMEPKESFTVDIIVAEYSELIRTILEEQKPPSTDDEPRMDVDPFNGGKRGRKV